MTEQRMSALALNKLTKPWEEFVPYPYDDKVPKLRQADGKRRYPEWTGGAVRGTITQGFGHTNAAGAPKIVIGQHWTEEYGTQVLATDIAPCEAAVRRLVKVELGQHQFDTLTDFVFNAGAGTLQKSTLLKKLNAGNYAAVPAELMKFTFSRGEHMDGLTHRREAEINIWNTPDEKPAAVRTTPEDLGVDAEDVACPKADMPPSAAPATMAQSTIGNSTIAAGGGTVVTTGAAVLKSVGENAPAPAAIDQATISDLIERANSGVDTATRVAELAPPPSVLKVMLTFATEPVVIGAVGALTLGFLGYVWFRRRQHLREDGV